MRIIVVDKSMLISSLIKEELLLDGHVIYEFDNARIAQSEIGKISPDLIICGGRFSDCFSGMEFLIWCRIVFNYKKIFVIASSYPTHEPELYIQNGANYYINKGIGFDNTIIEIKNVIKCNKLMV